MSIPTDEELLKQIDAFLSEAAMSPTRLGIEATGEGGLVKSIREGRSITLRTGRRLVEFMETYRSAQKATAGKSVNHTASVSGAAA